MVRILSAEIEFSFQPPSVDSEAEREEDEDERVRPCVQLFLLRYPELAQAPELTTRLIVLEYALRLRHDELPPNPESYLGMSTDEHGQLMKLFELAEHRVSSPRLDVSPIEPVGRSDSTVKEADAGDSIHHNTIPVNLGHFILSRTIGRGGMGFVHEAIDLRSAAHVALKIMRRSDAWSVYRFIEEFQWLSQLEHPNLVKLYDAFGDGDLRYFSMELVKGQTVRDWFQRLGSSTSRWHKLRAILQQVASAICYMHQNRVIHCDIKCSNVMIATRRRAVVLDLGLAVRQGQGNAMIGTVQYMAPELINGGKPTPASDWYSFGVMMFELMTDQYPPIQVSQCEKNQQVYSLDDEQLQSALRECDPMLATICGRLLANDPEQRLTGYEIYSMLGGDVGSLGDSTTSREEPCTGRSKELQLLDNSCEQIERGAAVCWLIYGDSGLGKTTLTNAWISSLDPSRYLVAQIRCYHQDHTPNRVVNSLIQELVRLLDEQPERLWKPTLQSRVESIQAVFPQVAQLLGDATLRGVSRDATAISGDARQKAYDEFVTWIAAVSTQIPLVIAVDDVQWSDESSRRVLAQLLRSNRFTGVILFAHDDRTACNESWLLPSSNKTDNRVEVSQLQLSPLTTENCTQLLKTWAKDYGLPLTESAAIDLAHSSDGNPFLLRELFRAYVRSTELEHVGTSDSVQGATRVAVLRRFASLPRDAEVVLQYLAVANQSLGFHQLQMATRIMPPELMRSLSLLRSQGWIRSIPEGAERDVEISHENFRRVVLEGLPDERLFRRHFRLARTLSSETPPPWPRIAGHYWAAERFREAAACYLEAARSAIAAGANAEALFFIQRAAHPLADRTVAEKRHVVRMRADCLAAIGSGHIAAEIYETLIEDSATEKEKLLLRCLAGEQWIRAGRLDTGLDQLRDTLNRLGLKGRRHGKAAQWRLQYRAIRTTYRQPEYVVDSDGEPFDEIEQCLNRIANPLTFLDNHLGPELILQLDQLANSKGSDADRAQSLLRTAVILSFAGGLWRLKAAEKLRTGRLLARSSKSPMAIALGSFCLFIWHLQRGAIKKAAPHGQRALQQFEQCTENTLWEQQFLQWVLLDVCWNSRQWELLRSSTLALRKSAQLRDDPMSIFWTHVNSAVWSDILADDTETARQSLLTAGHAIVNQSFQSPRFFLWLSRIHLHLYRNQAQEAQELLKADWRQLSLALILNTKHYRWEALCTRTCCDLLSAELVAARRSKYLARALRSARQLMKLQEPAYVAYGEAYVLVVDALQGNVAPVSRWARVIATLQQYGHQLMAGALEWHRSIYLPENFGPSVALEIEKQFISDGCARPRKLMNVLIPLPIQALAPQTINHAQI